MKKNLNIQTADSWCYENSTANCNKYGRLYTWEAANKACPSGWRLPDTADWNTLVNASGGMATAGKKLKSTSGWNNNGNGTNDYGFSALPGGTRDSSGGFGGAGVNGLWWTATNISTNNLFGIANSRTMYYINGYVSVTYHGTSEALSVRCVQ
jgi:uncharacterized protein (TIGR02145 family)